MTRAEPPVWRSLQYVPTHVEKFVASAHTRGADAIILDLEDSVPPDQKALARGLVVEAARRVGQAGADVIVRINSPPDMAAADVAAAVCPAVTALSLPKIEGPADVHRLAEAVALAERKLGMESGHTRFILLIESAEGFLHMADSAKASARIAAMILGAEDFSLDMGIEPSEETLLMARQQLIIAAAAAGVAPIGLVGSATRFDDPAYPEMARRSRRYGYVGATCIHPSQIPLLNAAFSPTDEEAAQAQRVIDALDAAERDGRGAVALDGRMIDIPIVNRAKKLIARKQAIDAREARMRAWKAND